MKKVLYLSYDGLTDPLGQSQIIPYLKGLAKLGHSITIISFEKKERRNQKEEISSLLARDGIAWVPLSYTKKPPVLSTLYDLVKLRRVSKQLILSKNIEIVHCRSYLTALTGQWAKKKFGIRFIFDMRGFWADERVEGGIWSLKSPIYKMMYKFFKQKEKEFLAEADHIVSLTQKAKKIIHSWQDIPGQPLPISVIPCCVDTSHFDPEKVKPEERQEIKRRLGIQEEDKVLTYLGSLGTWYMVEEMLVFFKELIKEHPAYKFLIITRDDPGIIEEKRQRLNIPKERIILTVSERKDLPALLSVSNLAISFILPSFSKSASSPTKLGELLSMGIPVICNKGVGDVDYLLKNELSGLLVEQADEFSFRERIENINLDQAMYRRLSGTHFSLTKGIEAYTEIYLTE